MADRRALRGANHARVPNSMMASARILSDRRLPIRPAEHWHDDAWRFYDDVGELRDGVTYIANALSRVRLIAATPGTPENPTPAALASGPAVDAVARLAGGAVGQAGMLAAFGVNLTVAGISYLVGETPADGPETWNVYSADVLRFQSELYSVQEDDAQSWRTLPEDALVVQIWRPHRRFPWQPDSSVRGVLKSLEELDLLNKRVLADALSRLAGAGILVIPSELEFPKRNAEDPEEDPLALELLEYMTIPVANRESAAAVVPFLLRVPGQWAEFVRHITTATPFDEKLLELRDAAIRRVAAGMDLPIESQTGLGSTNHWSAWQISDEAIELHIDPIMELICDGLTTGYLAPSLAADGEDPTSGVIWYDDSGLRTPADQSGKTLALYDRVEVKGDTARREAGLTEGDKPTPAERREQIIIHTAMTAPDSLPIVMAALDDLENRAAGGDNVDSLPRLPGAEPQDAPGPPEPTTTPPGPPQRPTAPPSAPGAPQGPTPPALPASSRPQFDALLAAVDGLVVRALERAGNKLRRRAGMHDDPTCPAGSAHCCVPQAVVAGANLDELLDGVWSRLPEIAERYRVEHVALRRFVDGYTRSLIASGTPHTYDTLGEAFGYTSAA